MARDDDRGDGEPRRAVDGAVRSAALRARLRRFFARRGAEEADLDDLVQDVFLKLVRGGRAPSLEAIDGYIVQAATSVLIDRWRARRARRSDQHVTFEPELHAPSVPSAEASLLAREGLRLGGLALMELPPRCRHVFMLRRAEGLPFSEIARRLNISVSAAEKDMLRAVRHLAVRMEELG